MINVMTKCTIFFLFAYVVSYAQYITNNGAETTNALKTWAELRKTKKEYKKKFGENVKVIAFPPDRFTNNDILAIFRLALKSGSPFPEKRYTVYYSDVLYARYELRFDRKVPICLLTEDACGNLPWMFGFQEIDTENCFCSKEYLNSLILLALRTGEPLSEKITANRLDLFMVAYKKTVGKESFPAWFNAFSYDDKMRCLEMSLKWRFEAMHAFDIFLSKKEEDSIKTQLGKVVAKYKKKMGREMTELEEAIAEYEIQFGCKFPKYQCQTDELLMVLRYFIKMNNSVLNTYDFINEQRLYAIKKDFYIGTPNEDCIAKKTKVNEK